eukprot:9152818-Pyramimonas_sp.AAC.1
MQRHPDVSRDAEASRLTGHYRFLNVTARGGYWTCSGYWRTWDNDANPSQPDAAHQTSSSSNAAAAAAPERPPS